MRKPLVAIAIALAILALAEIRDDRPPSARGHIHAACGQLMDSSVPEPDFPVITAAVSSSAALQTFVVGVESRRQFHSALSASTISHHPPLLAFATGKPRFFPLLI